MKTSALLACLLTSALIHAPLSKAEGTDDADMIAHGKQLHDQYCVKCHTDQVYTRSNHFVKSLDALHKQVERCKNNIGLQWFDDDVDAVVKYLNAQYYKF